MSHAIDLVHWFMDDNFPASVVAHGGVFAWHDGRENADTFQALLEYPKGFLVSYSTSFGNDAPSFTRYMGKKATLINIGGEGSPRYQVVEEKGTHEDDSDIDHKRKSRFISLPGEQGCLPWASMICLWSTWRTGSSACARGSSLTRQCTTASRILSRA